MGIRGGGGGGSTYTPVLQLPANALATPATNGAPLSRNDDIPVRLFDDATPEKVQGSFILPSNYNASGLVVFSVAVQPATDADANVRYSLEHQAIADGEAQSASYTTKDNNNTFAVNDDIADCVFIHDVSFLSAFLGWAAGDLVLFRFARDSAEAADTLSGDLRLYHMTIKVPVS